MADYPLLSLQGAPTNGVNEVQRLTPGGTISGGTFKITFEGQQTGNIAWNATAADVQAGLEALSNVAPGDVVVTGGPVQTAFLEILFTHELGGVNRTEVTVQSSLTGAAPTLTPSTPTGGVLGSFRGAQGGAKLQDTTNGILYENTGTRWAPVWTTPVADPEPSIVALTEPAGWATLDYADHSAMPKSNDYTYAPFTM